MSLTLLSAVGKALGKKALLDQMNHWAARFGGRPPKNQSVLIKLTRELKIIQEMEPER